MDSIEVCIDRPDGPGLGLESLLVSIDIVIEMLVKQLVKRREAKSLCVPTIGSSATQRVSRDRGATRFNGLDRRLAEEIARARVRLRETDTTDTMRGSVAVRGRVTLSRTG